MADFIPGIELSRLFFFEAVKPVLDAEFPRLRYGAALIGTGSEVLGFDTEMSADHHWGRALTSSSERMITRARARPCARRSAASSRTAFAATRRASPSQTRRTRACSTSSRATRARSRTRSRSRRRAALSAAMWREREEHFSAGYERVAEMHNALGITDPLPTEPRDFFGRPFKVIALHGFTDALLSRITDERVRRVAARRPIGSLDQFSDSTDLISHAGWRATLRKLYE
ncbi:MAG: hypothetical protein DMF67_12580 [Acidobacteria bacterium]|nr:MAG: hypothetical protein DMF67_12580 [Acidobacteriota bacterium]